MGGVELTDLDILLAREAQSRTNADGCSFLQAHCGERDRRRGDRRQRVRNREDIDGCLERQVAGPLD